MRSRSHFPVVRIAKNSGLRSGSSTQFITPEDGRDRGRNFTKPSHLRRLSSHPSPMHSSVFLARTVSFNSVAYAILVLSQAFRTGDRQKQSEKASPEGKVISGCANPLTAKALTAEMKSLLAIVIGASTVIMMSQLAITAFEPFSNPGTSDCTESIESSYTPPNLGRPDRSLGSATR